MAGQYDKFVNPQWKLKVQELCDLEEGLSERELEFVEQLSHLPRTTQLSKAQREWLDALHERLCG
jgi:hypothetical protein